MNEVIKKAVTKILLELVSEGIIIDFEILELDAAKEAQDAL